MPTGGVSKWRGGGQFSCRLLQVTIISLPLSYVAKKAPCHMFNFRSICVILSLRSCVEFKKRLCRRVNFRGLEPSGGCCFFVFLFLF